MKFIKLAAVSAVSATIMMLSGCGNTDVDINALSQELKGSGIFAEDLSDVSQNIACKRIGVNSDDVTECAAAAGTKAVVDEIVIVKSTNSSGVEESMKKHIEKQKDSYASYRPEEVPKLEEYVLMTSGEYNVLVVSEDSKKAKEIVRKYIK